MSTIEFRWAARRGDALVAASGSGAAGRKGRGTVGARVPTVRQERTSGMSADLHCGLVAHNRAGRSQAGGGEPPAGGRYASSVAPARQLSSLHAHMSES